ncbi:MAG: aldo/keto reductase [Anaerolineae bacterium]|jgi:predicted aldo/keto reductase-like oxidoreductase
MQTRRFGRTEHDSTILVFGAFAVGQLSQKEADGVMEMVLEHGINHIDVAPSYHDAELRLGPWLADYRDRFFLGCKTELRDSSAAREEMHQSLGRLQVEAFDLYQLHAVTTMQQLDQCFAPGGSMEVLLEARDQGLTRYLGITSHGLQAPAVQMEALRRFDFDSLLFPLNFKLWADEAYRRDAQALLKMAAERDVGTMVIKALAKGPWGDQVPRYHTWYEPFETQGQIDQALHFALSQPVTTAISSGDARLLPMIIDAAERFEPMSDAEQQQILATASEYEPLFTE